jgi:hypothetical protein
MVTGISRGVSFRPLQPTVGDHRLIIFALARKFVVLRCAKDVGIFVGPDFAVTSDGDNLVDHQEAKVKVGFPATYAVLGPGPILKDFHAPLVDEHIGGFVNFQAEFCSHHARQFGPFATGNYHGGQWGKGTSCNFFLPSDTRGIAGSRRGRGLRRRTKQRAACFPIPRQKSARQ